MDNIRSVDTLGHEPESSSEFRMTVDDDDEWLLPKQDVGDEDKPEERMDLARPEGRRTVLQCAR